MTSPHLTWVEVNLAALEYNTRLVAQRVNVPIMAVVKDNGYGHGAVEVSRAALHAGASWLAVVRAQEGLELRRAGITAPLLVMSGVLPAEVDAALAHDLTLPLFDAEIAAAIAQRAAAAGITARVHLKIDTGMGRFGVFAEEALPMAQHALSLGALEIEGLFSHLAAAGEDDAATARQLRRFQDALQALKAGGIQPRQVHLANTAAIIHAPDTFFNMVRAGGVLYGQGIGEPPLEFTGQLRRTFAWKTQLLTCKQYPAGYGVGYGQTYHTRAGEWIGVAPVGYGDGYQRAPGNVVLIGGQRVPVVGRVCMDQILVSLPRHYPPGEEIVLVGAQGSERITQEEVQARWRCSFSAVTLVQPRVPRVYL